MERDGAVGRPGDLRKESLRKQSCAEIGSEVRRWGPAQGVVRREQWGLLLRRWSGVCGLEGVRRGAWDRTRRWSRAGWTARPGGGAPLWWLRDSGGAVTVVPAFLRSVVGLLLACPQSPALKPDDPRTALTEKVCHSLFFYFLFFERGSISKFGLQFSG